MNARMRLPTLMLLGFLAFAAVSWAQVSSIEGDVKGEDGLPLKGALIKLDRQDIKGHYQVKTDKKGHYFYGGLPLGVYNISCEVDGVVKDSVNKVHTQLGDPTEVPFNLKLQADRNAALQKAAETGTMSKEQERSLSPNRKPRSKNAPKRNPPASQKTRS